jgi:hypothetical protein
MHGEPPAPTPTVERIVRMEFTVGAGRTIGANAAAPPQRERSDRHRPHLSDRFDKPGPHTLWCLVFHVHMLTYMRPPELASTFLRFRKVVWGDAPADRSTACAQRLEGAVRIWINPNKSSTDGSRGRSICEGLLTRGRSPFWNEDREKVWVAAVRNRRRSDVRKENICLTRRVSASLHTFRARKEIPDEYSAL